MPEVFINSIFISFLIFVLAIETMNRFKTKGLIVITLFCFIVLTYLGYLDSPDSSKEHKHSELIISILIMNFVPLCFLALIVKLSHRLNQKRRYIVALFASIIGGIAWPFFGLVTVCTVGLDCI